MSKQFERFLNANELIGIHISNPSDRQIQQHPRQEINPEIGKKFWSTSEDVIKMDSIRWNCPSGSPTKYFTEDGDTIHKNNETNQFYRKIRQSENRQKWQDEALPDNLVVYRIIFKYGEYNDKKRRISIICRENEENHKTCIVEYVPNEHTKKRKREQSGRSKLHAGPSSLSEQNSTSVLAAGNEVEQTFGEERSDCYDRCIDDLANEVSEVNIGVSLSSILTNSCSEPLAKQPCHSGDIKDEEEIPSDILSDNAMNSIQNVCSIIENMDDFNDFGDNSNIFIGRRLKQFDILGNILPMDKDKETIYKVASKYEEKKDREWNALLTLENGEFYMWSAPYLISDKNDKCVCLRFDLLSCDSDCFFILVRSIKDDLIKKSKKDLPISFDLCAKVGDDGHWTSYQSFKISEDNKESNGKLRVEFPSNHERDRMPSLYLKLSNLH